LTSFSSIFAFSTPRRQQGGGAEKLSNVVNPEIVWSSEERSTYEEGCLSIPEYLAEVERPASVRRPGP
jgi:peptide deformylase